MKKLRYMILAILLFTVRPALATEVTFSVIPNTQPGDTAVIIEARVTTDNSDGTLVNAIEGRIGILGEGSDSVTDVVIETGDSIFSLWPYIPTYNKTEQSIQFTGGSPQVVESGRLFRMRLFTLDTKPITISWLGGSAYSGDGFGTAVGISSRSLVVIPEIGEPNLISSTSEDSEPPTIVSIEISQDPDVFDGKYFLSVYATDNKTGVSHYEVVEQGIRTRIENGPYLLSDQTLNEQLLVSVQDKAGNSISVKIPEKDTFHSYKFIALILLLFGTVLLGTYLRSGRR